MRLLRLPAEVRAAVAAGKLDMGHARALLAVQDEARLLQLARQAIEGGLSVREVERLARGARATARKSAGEGPGAAVRKQEDALTRALGTRVRIRERRGRGDIRIAFSSQTEYVRLAELLLQKGGR
jgi:ParB family chromosome partitioning protein